jgi:hypothetical protein
MTMLDIKNPTLTQIAAKTASMVDPRLRPVFERGVMAGLKVMHSSETHRMMIQQLTRPGNPAENAGEAAAKLVGLLIRDSRGSLPMEAMVPAGQVLLCYGLDFMEQAGQITADNKTIAAAFKAYASALLQLFNISPGGMQQAIQQGLAARQQPQQPQQVPQAQAGVINGAMGAR